MRFRFIATIAAAAVVSVGAQGQGRAPQLESIREDQLRADLFFLAGDSMQGRLTDTPTNGIAADWIRSRFERLGLRPGGNAGFEHRYQLMTASLSEPNEMSIEAAGLRQGLRPGVDFYPHRFSASAAAKGAVVFAGFGIVSPERGHDDYKDAVRGHVALVLDNEPGADDPESVFDGVVRSEASSPVHKAIAAERAGAVALVMVEDAHNQTGPPANFAAQSTAYWPDPAPRIERYTLMSFADRVHIPVVQVSRAVAERLIGTKHSLTDLGRASEATGGVAPVPLGVTVAIETSVTRHTVADRSIVAVLEGSDPSLKDEHVLVGAHIDHNGADDSGIFSGADDDGSGIVGLLEIAEAYVEAARAGQRPRRSIIFAAWNSEERGLLGAWAYAESPVVPLDRIVANLNMDMIGRNEEVQVGGGNRFRGLDVQTAESNANATNLIGSVRSPDLKAVFDRANKGIDLDLRYRYDNNVSNLMRRSDHWPFIQHGVPGIWVHTGLHPDYHTVFDRPEKINYAKMEKIVRLVYQASWDLAQGSGRPALLPVAKAPTSAR
jgi:Zn-dependent M28 family amino/carboxypeptidase